MPFAKGNRGRPKGSPNKVTASVRAAILLCFDDIGGREAFAKWAKKNQTAYYTQLYGKMVPVDVNHGGNIGLTIREASELISEVFGGGTLADAAVSAQVGAGQKQIPGGAQGETDSMDNDGSV